MHFLGLEETNFVKCQRIFVNLYVDIKIICRTKKINFVANNKLSAVERDDVFVGKMNGSIIYDSSKCKISECVANEILSCRTRRE